MVIFMYSVLNIENTITIEKSKFITSLFYIENEQDITKYMNLVKEKYKNATHYCYAYIIGNIKRFSDHKEPSNTAGMPILNCLEKNNLNHILCIVTRYFGGIKLGAGGLIRAYSNSITEAAQNIGVVKCVMQQLIEFIIPYNRLDEINHYLNENKILIANQIYTTDVTIQIFLDLDQITQVEEDLINLLSGKVDFKKIDQRFNEIPVTNLNFHEQ